LVVDAKVRRSGAAASERGENAKKKPLMLGAKPALSLTADKPGSALGK